MDFELKKSSCATIPKSGGHNDEAVWPKGDADKSICGTILLETEKRGFKCEVCGGIGHRYFQCPTKEWLDKHAKRCGDVSNWGQWKYEHYYKDIDDVNKEKDKKEARKFAAARRKRFWKFKKN